MPVLNDFRAFNVDEASVSLWVFKSPGGASNEPPRYSGRWVETTDDVDSVLKGIVRGARERINEVIEYDLLAQNNEGSALVIPANETYANRLVEVTAAETADRRATNVDHLRNSSFYDIKLAWGDSVIHAIRKTENTWQGKRARSLETLLFRGDVLALEVRPKFDIDKNIDFVIIGGEILVLKKGNFESTLRYKATFVEDFADLQVEQAFLDSFADIEPLVAYVGQNKLHLRRLAAVRQKGHYRDLEFMKRLRALHAAYGLNLQFSGDGKIIVTAETCREVITALLDHRLASAFSEAIYDVPSTTTITVR